ncbi:hypothetical protein JW752_04080 [Candidatus Peregrinibacteria bacterium]|nr:hypothetical protein [Candidatus Peregrinibacteria bacterium]
MEKGLILAAIIGPIYLFYGLSFLLYPKQWKRLIQECIKNHFSMQASMFVALLLGLIIINAYNVWEWNRFLIITLTGWLFLIKGVFYLLTPERCIKWVMARKCCQSKGWLYIWGTVMTILGVLLSYNAYIA